MSMLGENKSNWFGTWWTMGNTITISPWQQYADPETVWHQTNLNQVNVGLRCHQAVACMIKTQATNKHDSSSRLMSHVACNWDRLKMRLFYIHSIISAQGKGEEEKSKKKGRDEVVISAVTCIFFQSHSSYEPLRNIRVIKCLWLHGGRQGPKCSLCVSLFIQQA